MKQIRVRKAKIDLKEYKMRSAQEGDYSTLIDEPRLIFDGDDLVMAYMQIDENPSRIKRALQSIRYEKGTRSSGMVSHSRIFGYSPRITVRNDFCTATSLSREQPQEHQVIIDYAARVAKQYREINPAIYASHDEATASNVEADYHIKSSPFTSGIINKNNPLNYHFDTGNFRDVWSCMLVFKHHVGGGYLSVPEYDMAFALRDNSLFMFDGQNILHGVTPIRKKREDAFRYSIVYYSLRQMWNCLPVDDEIIRIRNKRVEREEKRAGL